MPAPLLLLGFAFFLSGMAAVGFESLWFRGAGLALGNGVWAASIVTAAFMAGLAVGNAAAIRFAARLVSPFRVYALLELTVAAVGFAVVALQPLVTPFLASILGPLAASSAALHALRAVAAFLLLAVPAAAMGMTLPVGMEALAQSGDRPMGPSLGLLYGSNTLGAVAGALLWEGVLVPEVGVRGAALVAAGVDILAAGLALMLARMTLRSGSSTAVRDEPALPDPPMIVLPRPTDVPRHGADVEGRHGSAAPLLFAAAVGGAALLGLESAWFRLLLQFVCGTSLAFAAMLAAVLAGIGLGASLAGAVLVRWPGAAHLWPAVGAMAAALATLGYATFDPTTARSCGLAAFGVTLPLAGPTSVASGVLFTFLGAALRGLPRTGSDGTGAPAEAGTGGRAKVVGRLTLANTMGALVGGAAAPLLLMPWAGVEGTLFMLVFAYGLVVVSGLAVRGDRAVRLGAMVAFVLWMGAVIAFPSGAMRSRYLPESLRGSLTRQRMTVVATREGLTETATLLRSDMWGHPVAWRLATNGYSMSAIGWGGERYMRLFSYWPAAVHPRPRRALLISYGLGSTAAALNEIEGLTHIDVVDISADILDLNRTVRPLGLDPLADPRVHVHVEDGRQFLQLTRETYDIITGEPPPPLQAGVVNLYSAEYFRLIHDRLAEGGIATYWLPMHSVPAHGARAVVSAFCDAFSDCSLWNASGFDWMLVGTRGRAVVDEAAASRLWETAAGSSLRRAGFDDAGTLFATFLADRNQLRKFADGAPPVTDDRPYRIGRYASTPVQVWGLFLSPEEVSRRFETSAQLRGMLPPELLAATRRALPHQGVLSRRSREGALFPAADALAYVARGGRRHVTLALLGLNEEVVAAVPTASEEAFAHFVRGASALANGAFAPAARDFERAAGAGTPVGMLGLWPALASCLAGDVPAARRWLGASPEVSALATHAPLQAFPAHCRP